MVYMLPGGLANTKNMAFGKDVNVSGECDGSKSNANRKR